MQVGSVYWSSRNIFTLLSAPKQSIINQDCSTPSRLEVEVALIKNNSGANRLDHADPLSSQRVMVLLYISIIYHPPGQ